MDFCVRPMREQEAKAIIGWRYEAPYSLYNLSPESMPSLLDTENRYHSVTDGEGRLLGFCCFGREARVIGGDYQLTEPRWLDVGVGLHPDWTGRGYGREFIAAILEFAEGRFSPTGFRVTIAAFNLRSRRAFEALGFKVAHQFERARDGLKFVQLERLLK